MNSEQVKTSLGTPHDGTVGQGSAFYYISSVESQQSFLPPKEKDRRVVAVYFSQLGSVDRVAQYGLKDGKVFDYVKNETPTHAKDEGILKSCSAIWASSSSGSSDAASACTPSAHLDQIPASACIASPHSVGT